MLPTKTGPRTNPWYRNGIATLKGGTKDMDTKRAVRVNGFIDLIPQTAITKKAPFTGAPTIPVKSDAVASSESWGGATCQSSIHKRLKNGTPRNNISLNQTTARHQKRNVRTLLSCDPRSVSF